MPYYNVELPLYPEEDFSYTVALQENAYDLRLYYNRRMEQWFLELLRDDGTEVLMGIGIHPYYPVMSDYEFEDLTGFFWLQPKNFGKDEAATNPEKLSEYFKLFYIWEEE